MIDFWEALGRLVYDPALANDFIGKFPEGGFAIAKAEIDGQKGLDIPGKKYVEIQEFFDHVLSEGTLSIMSAGELYLTFSLSDAAQNLRNLQTFVLAHLKNMRIRSTGYFIALGMIIADRYFRERIAAGEHELQTGPVMSAAERNDIIQLAKNKKFGVLATAFGRWDTYNCFGHAVYWPCYLQPMDSTENADNYDDKDRCKKKRAIA